MFNLCLGFHMFGLTFAKLCRVVYYFNVITGLEKTVFTPSTDKKFVFVINGIFCKRRTRDPTLGAFVDH